MIPGELPYCEFDRRTGRFTAIRNCASEADRDRAAKEHIERNRERLKARSGLEKKKRIRLHKEIDELERTFKLGRYSPVAQVDDKRTEKRLKAEGKKLQWFARKKDQAGKPPA
jgi:hypothetical protein